MADVKTHLRELSVAVGVGLLLEGKEIDFCSLNNSQTFYSLAEKYVNNDISLARNILTEKSFSPELQTIIQNGIKLGKKIYECGYFKIAKDDKIYWLGADTQKEDPVDLKIGKYEFSLKEESFILENMGLYRFLNYLTGSKYRRGMHVFKEFAPKEFEDWFNYTWNSFGGFLRKFKEWELDRENKKSKAYIKDNEIVMVYNEIESKLPFNLKNYDEYMKLTSSETREEVFSKWIKEHCNKDKTYLKVKKRCSEIAGIALIEKLNKEYNYNNIAKFFRIYDKIYYFAKTTKNETTILKVQTKDNMPNSIVFQECTCTIPSSQLNIITTFKNKKTGKTLEFRNECRFSHGQFNGTPEAKMYVVRNKPLTELYSSIDEDDD